MDSAQLTYDAVVDEVILALVNLASYGAPWPPDPLVESGAAVIDLAFPWTDIPAELDLHQWIDLLTSAFPNITAIPWQNTETRAIDVAIRITTPPDDELGDLVDHRFLLHAYAAFLSMAPLPGRPVYQFHYMEAERIVRECALEILMGVAWL